MRATLLSLALLLTVVTVPQLGCGASLAAVIASVVAAATEASGWVQAIADFADAALDRVPDSELRAKLDKAVYAARVSALALSDAARGADHLTRQELDKAFADFQAAYAELLAVAKSLGVRVAGTPGKYSATATSLEVPPPEHFALRPTS